MALDRLYKRRFPLERVYANEQARELALLSHAINRQLGLLIDRSGKVQLVIVGDRNSIYIPDLPRLAQGKLRGWRLLHTHLSTAAINAEDMLDTLFLRLDCTVALTVNEEGEPLQWQGCWVMPQPAPDSLLELAGNPGPHSSYISVMRAWHDADLRHVEIAASIDAALPQSRGVNAARENAILVSVSSTPLPLQERNLDELAELAASAGLTPCDRLAWRVREPDPRLILGKGKLAELEIMALGANADTIIFDGELTPNQLNNLAQVTERKVIDRTQLILDIFAQRATTRTGKLQVELAQLNYMQPRLAGSHKAMDRLMGGIGGRGPGESRLETDRRKSRERMAALRRELERIKKQRKLARQKRLDSGIPLAALVGYTNAGKSTLLNILSRSATLVQNKLFATLDPVTRRLRFPEEREITVSDTVGFIRNLPAELLEAFAATLEELYNAAMLVHVADSSHPEMEQQIASVRNTLEELGLAETPALLVLNKCDKLKPQTRENLQAAWPNAIFISAATGEGLKELLEQIKNSFFTQRQASADKEA